MKKQLQNKTLFEKIGGEKAVSEAVEIFYKKVLSDKRVNYFFKDTDMKKQIRHQKRFLTYAFGGTKVWKGETLHNVHKKVREKGLNESHFNAICENLFSSLKELGVGDEEIKEIEKIVMSTKNDILF